jgi:hypothetical protein
MATMEKERICIDGQWYVREDSATAATKKATHALNMDNINHCIDIEYDASPWKFNAQLFLLDDAEAITDHYSGLYMRIENTKESPAAVDNSDNNSWLIGVLEENPESMGDADDIFGDDKEGLAAFQAFIQYLVDTKRLKK